MLRDTTPDEAEDVEAVKAPAAAGAENEADPPEPFEWEPRSRYVRTGQERPHARRANRHGDRASVNARR